MSIKTQILIVVLAISAFISGAQTKTLQPEMHFFTDRSSCVSGDSVWMYVKLPEIDGIGDIVHVQLCNHTGKEIRTVLLKSDNNWADGYIPVPDSMETGQYFVTVWMPHHSNSVPFAATKQLLVYNRFDEQVDNILLQPKNTAVESPEKSIVKIVSNAEIFNSRSVVNVGLSSSSNDSIENAIIKASLVDPLTEGSDNYNFSFAPIILPEKGFIEKGGSLISGKVTDSDGNLQKHAMVVLSISSDNYYFDYYVTGSDGLFHFFVKDAFGNSEIIFQVFSAAQKDFKVELLNSVLIKTGEPNQETHILTIDEDKFVKNAIESSFIQRIFFPPRLVFPDSLKMPVNLPFYGTYTSQIIPGNFVDLDNFREISRELLNGVQYRERNESINLRILNQKTDRFFDEEPIKLINGIPVFDNQIIARLKSTDIKTINLVKNHRIFGDLAMNGVLDITLYDKSNKWLAGVPNVFRFDHQFLQTPKFPVHQKNKPVAKTEPDLRQVFFWQKTESIPGNFSFSLSDRTGLIEISVEGITTGNKYFKSTKIIEVK